MADKPLVWLHGEVKTPPFTSEARVEAGVLLRRVQRGENPSMPHSEPLPEVGPHCHSLRIKDADNEWRIVYRIDPDVIVIAEVYGKTTRKIPRQVAANCKRRLTLYDEIRQERGR